MTEPWHPAQIIADLLATSLMPPDGTWASARSVYCWEREGIDYLHRLKAEGARPSINAWTAMIVEQGYPGAKAGGDCGKHWKPPT